MISISIRFWFIQDKEEAFGGNQDKRYIFQELIHFTRYIVEFSEVHALEIISLV